MCVWFSYFPQRLLLTEDKGEPGLQAEPGSPSRCTVGGLYETSGSLGEPTYGSTPYSFA
jgi:hypothetical protein